MSRNWLARANPAFGRAAVFAIMIAGGAALGARAQETAQAEQGATAAEGDPLPADDPIADLIQDTENDGKIDSAVLVQEPVIETLAAEQAVSEEFLDDKPAETLPEPDAAAENTKNDAAPAPLTTVPEGRANPPMWRLTDEDSEVWLLGTFHILPKGLDWRSDALAHAVDAAETIYFEAEVDSPDAQRQSVNILMTEGFNKKGVTLSSLLETGDAELLKKIAGEMNVPMAALDTMRPWQAFLTLSIQFIVGQGFDPGSGVETVLLREARIRGRDLKFFETVEGQIRLFTSLEPEVEKNLLALTIREWENQENQFQTLFNAWRNGDTQTINTLMNETMRAEAPEVYQALLADRNVAWAAKIDEIMKGSGKVLIAVGAAHLVGDDSVRALLREKGYDVTRYGVDE